MIVQHHIVLDIFRNKKARWSVDHDLNKFDYALPGNDSIPHKLQYSCPLFFLLVLKFNSPCVPTIPLGIINKQT